MDEPSKVITVLGFEIKSIDQAVRITPEKQEKIIQVCTELIQLERATIRFVAHFIGKRVLCFPGVELGPLHYRELEINKSKAVARNHENYKLFY